MLLNLPILRRDLLISPHTNEGATTFVIKDPIARRFFRFGEVEHSIARRLDGATTLETVRESVEREFGVRITAETVQQFVDELRRIGLLQSDQLPDRECHHHRRRVTANPLYIRLKAFDPDRLFDRVVNRVWFFFTPWFVLIWLMTLVAALAIVVADWDEIVRDLRQLYRFDALLLAWIAVLVVTTAHEFAHGLTCKHFGGEVREIGFLLLYFQPAFYCNISDAWLFPEKSKRLWVTFAGAFFETFVWSLATLTWRVTERDTLPNFLAMIVMASSGIKSLFNLNPLIKLDGYYLLSDYLEIPNLRQRSTAYLKSIVRRLWQSTTEALEVTRRERRIYVTYGMLAVAYSSWLLGVVALRFGHYLIEEYRWRSREPSSRPFPLRTWRSSGRTGP